jgi:hypothetical protein
MITAARDAVISAMHAAAVSRARCPLLPPKPAVVAGAGAATGTRRRRGVDLVDDGHRRLCDFLYPVCVRGSESPSEQLLWRRSDDGTGVFFPAYHGACVTHRVHVRG